ncbi:hypothetical protein BC781_11075 [Sediminitomix flava]|uniref:Uncharacterized protein n=1 Tax=Sediminitomix flava TaxID=379075 RepID=A0A315ZLI3_SEDFL|nr:hypothetical protein BC781_11075 [Sediminitomix flava]
MIIGIIFFGLLGSDSTQTVFVHQTPYHTCLSFIDAIENKEKELFYQVIDHKRLYFNLNKQFNFDKKQSSSYDDIHGLFFFFYAPWKQSPRTSNKKIVENNIYCFLSMNIDKQANTFICNVSWRKSCSSTNKNILLKIEESTNGYKVIDADVSNFLRDLQ